MENVKKIIKSEHFKIAYRIILCLIAAMLIFQAGMFVGFHKAYYSNVVGGEYFRAFRGGSIYGGMMSGRDDFINSHGAIGKIAQVNFPTLVVEDKEGIEKTIKVSSSTEIRDMAGEKMTDDLKVGEFVTVFGRADDSIISARLIRIMPEPKK